MIIIGITGTNGAGKDTIVEYLVREKGFVHFSVKSLLIEELNTRSLPLNRISMINLANELRKEYGSNYLVEKLYTQATKTNSDTVIESLRNPSEVEWMKKKESFILFGINADIDIRYKRIRIRNGEKDNVSMEQFIEQENFERNSGLSTGQNIDRCLQLADFTFQNNGSRQELYKKINTALKTIRIKN